MKKRDPGEPAVMIQTLPGTPEQVAQNRECLRQECEKIMSRLTGCSQEVKLLWPDDDRNEEVI